MIIFLSQGLCSIRGALAQLQSRAQLTVGGHKLLATGFNVSAADGRLALLLSFSPPASNQTGAQASLDTTLSAQFKGQIIPSSKEGMCSPTWVHLFVCLSAG